MDEERCMIGIPFGSSLWLQELGWGSKKGSRRADTRGLQIWELWAEGASSETWCGDGEERADSSGWV